MTQKDAIERIKRTMRKKEEWRNEFSNQYADVENLYVYMKEHSFA